MAGTKMECLGRLTRVKEREKRERPVSITLWHQNSRSEEPGGGRGGETSPRKVWERPSGVTLWHSIAWLVGSAAAE